MTNKMTVGELIEILSKVDPTLPVKMSMNMEYESYVDSDMVGVRDYDNGPRLYISDSLDIQTKEFGVAKPVGGLCRDLNPSDGQALLSYTKDGRISDASHELRQSRWNNLACNVVDRQVRGRHGRAGSKLFLLSNIPDCMSRGSPLGRASDCLSDLGGFDSRPRRQVISGQGHARSCGVGPSPFAIQRLHEKCQSTPGATYQNLPGFLFDHRLDSTGTLYVHPPLFDYTSIASPHQNVNR